MERTGSGIGGSLLSSRQGSPRTEHGILSTIPASEHFDNPLLTTCAPCLMCATLFSDAMLACVLCKLRRSRLLLIPWCLAQPKLTNLSWCESLPLHSIWQFELSVPRVRGRAQQTGIHDAWIRITLDLHVIHDAGCLQGWILQGAWDEHRQRALQPETGTPTSASHPWVLHRQPCCAWPMQTAASEQMTGTLVEAKLPVTPPQQDTGR